MINWTPVIERHSSGNTELGKVWLRTDRQNLVTGVYTLFGKTKKFVPNPNETWSVEEGMIIAELALEEELNFRQMISQIKKTDKQCQCS